jgi:hypothetical protein
MFLFILGALALVVLIVVRQQIRRFIERRLAESGGPSSSMDEMIRRRGGLDVEGRRQR